MGMKCRTNTVHSWVLEKMAEKVFAAAWSEYREEIREGCRELCRQQTYSRDSQDKIRQCKKLMAKMLLEPHLSGTLLILAIGAVLMFVGGTGLRWFALAGGLGAAAIAAAVVLLPQLVPYATDRLASWRNPFADPLGEGHQTIQSLYAIASGGLAGLGLGNSRQKYLYVPEPQNDFIFSILCEELGFIGAALVVALFLLLLLRGMSIAVRARDKFGALLTVGFVVQVILQAILNIAVVTNTIPNTGISLPFFSSGGTSLLMLLGEMGIVLSVSRQTDMV